MQMQWTTFAMALLAAFIIGGLLSRFFFSKDGQDRSGLRRQLDELKKQHQSYQINVTEHFSRTTDLIEELNTNYSRIQEHLAHGADEFIQPEYRLESARRGAVNLEDLAPPSKTNDASDFVPRDYAPKAPNEEGTLSETYGLKRSDFETKEPKKSPAKN